MRSRRGLASADNIARSSSPVGVTTLLHLKDSSYTYNGNLNQGGREERLWVDMDGAPVDQ
ncbi:hypothetical protein GCM10022248_29090 [Nonomuraea soli]